MNFYTADALKTATSMEDNATRHSAAPERAARPLEEYQLSEAIIISADMRGHEGKRTHGTFYAPRILAQDSRDEDAERNNAPSFDKHRTTTRIRTGNPHFT